MYFKNKISKNKFKSEMIFDYIKIIDSSLKDDIKHWKLKPKCRRIYQKIEQNCEQIFCRRGNRNRQETCENMHNFILNQGNLN